MEHTCDQFFRNFDVALDKHLLDHLFVETYPLLLEHVVILFEQNVYQLGVRRALVFVSASALLVPEDPRIEDQSRLFRQFEHHLRQERLVLLLPLRLFFGESTLLDRFS